VVGRAKRGEEIAESVGAAEGCEGGVSENNAFAACGSAYFRPVEVEVLWVRLVAVVNGDGVYAGGSPVIFTSCHPMHNRDSGMFIKGI
jgi:hypothetical protein